MTIILTCLTRDFIVQASDRRFSCPERSKSPEDHNNKALIFSNHFVFAFTGLARLNGKSAIDWAAQQLSERENLRDSVIHLGNQASDLINNYYSSFRPERKMLAFIGAGFVDVEENGRQNRKPLRIVVSNFRGENDTMLTQARKGFKVYFDWLPERRNFDLFVAGQNLPKGREDKLKNIIMWCLRHKKGPETIGRFLTREIQAMDNPTVGKNIMCSFVPRAFSNAIHYHPGGILFENPVKSNEPQHLKPADFVSVHDRFAILPPFDDPRFVYIAGDNQALPYHGPVLVIPGLPGNVMQMSIGMASLTVPPFVHTPNKNAL